LIAAGGTGAILAFTPAAEAVTNLVAPQTGPVIGEDDANVPGVQLRLPPDAAGIAPPEPNPAAIAADKRRVDAAVVISDQQRQRISDILTTDAFAQSLLKDQSWRIAAIAPWGDEDPLKGAGVDIVLDQALTTGTMLLPAVEAGPGGRLVTSTFTAQLVNIQSLTLLVGFDTNSVLQVLPDTAGAATVIYAGQPPHAEED
jgi:hypothetical protein